MAKTSQVGLKKGQVKPWRATLFGSKILKSNNAANVLMSRYFFECQHHGLVPEECASSCSTNHSGRSPMSHRYDGKRKYWMGRIVMHLGLELVLLNQALVVSAVDAGEYGYGDFASRDGCFDLAECRHGSTTSIGTGLLGHATDGGRPPEPDASTSWVFGRQDINATTAAGPEHATEDC